jgi:hypothetical protein
MMRIFIQAAAVAWVAMICFVFSFFVSKALDNFTPELDRTKPKWVLFLEVAVQFGIVGILVWAARSWIKKIPFALEGTAGFAYSKLGELRSLPLLVFIFMFFQTRTQEKMRFLSR